ncbi:flagellar assembly peptidoglycan hydrolase FlgJ [Paraglaciecola chathamensis]|uniref:flagellar assembly peptidoglycan hydrolase FlgJ n=1 Tax=Paraglaciecola chathamensis TaxID=368405 RepID=UPI0026F5D923|nr:flagellar assembly peptidoglycan hydrolase FlgJ [Paraglaciecola chathamensis]MDO6558172.1 flagellar assembly peptidoglycan hydrolase FlgJ [Paraglaciecola chathamensis]
MDSIDNSIKFQGQFDMSRNANDIQGLDKLRRAAQSGDDAALQEAAKQFEAIFVQMMLKSMRKAQDVMADKDSPFNSEQVKFYRDMHDQQLATDMSNNGSIGLADIIVKQLSKGGNGFTPSSVIRNDANLSDINRHSAQSIEQAQQLVLPESVSSNVGYKDAAFRDQNEFLDTLYPVAQQVAKELGIDPKALLAQAAVETGWGQYMMHTDNGNTHNLFGIKAGNGWQGDTANVSTIEFEQGLAAPKKAKFRAYNSFNDAMQDYASFVKDNPRYQQALEHTGDPKNYFNELQQAGYATDPAYADKILSVLNSGSLRQYQP